MNNNAYVHSEDNNNQGTEDEQHVAAASMNDATVAGEGNSASEVATEDRTAKTASVFSGLVQKSRVMGGRLAGTLKKSGTADPGASGDSVPTEAGDQEEEGNVAPGKETDGPKPEADNRNKLLQKFGKRKADYSVQQKEAETSGGPATKNADVPGSNKLRQMMSNWGQNRTQNGRAPRNHPNTNELGTASSESPGESAVAHVDSLESQPTSKRQARFPNANLLFQKYISKHQADRNTKNADKVDGDKEGEGGDENAKEIPRTKATWGWPLTNGVKSNKLENGNVVITPVITAAPQRRAGRGEDDGVKSTDTMCGGFGWYPGWLQRFATPRQFLLAFCLQNVLQGAAASLFIGTSTSVEKHFHFASKDLGSILMFSEIGPIFTSLTLSHLGGRGNRPRWMACGQLLSMLGLLLAFANYLFYPPPEISELADPGGSRKLCRYTDLLKELVVPLNQLGQTVTASLRSLDTTNCFAHNQSAFFSWIIVHTLIGIGNSMVYTIGAPYLDDSIKKKDSPLYFAISISVRILGPLLGFSLTAALLKVYVHPLSNPGLQPSDPRWVGAWWIGCLSLGFLFAVVALITSIFPRKMKDSPSEETEESPSRDPEAGPEVRHKTNGAVTFHLGEEADQRDVTQEGRDQVLEATTPPGGSKTQTLKEKLKLLWETLKRLCRNPVIVYGIAGDFFGLSGMLAIFMWLPKYLEHQFRVDKSTSALFTGISGTSSIIIGVLGGGMFIKRCRPTARTLTLIIIVCKMVYIVTLVGMMHIHCDFNDDLPGVLTLDGESLELHRGCSGGCECSKQEFIPVCVTDGPLKVTFFSPCHAGCYTPNAGDHGGSGGLVSLSRDGTELGATALSPADDGVTHYSNCSCGSPNAEVRGGYCRTTCSGFTLFNLVHATVNSFVSLGTIGGVLIALRCVATEDKAPSLGLKSSVMSLAMLLNPVIFGSLTDSSCLVWEEACGQTGACWVYNARDLGYKIFTSAIILFSISAVLEYFVYRNVKNVKLFDEEPKQRSPSSRTLSTTLSSVFGSCITNRVSNCRPTSETGEVGPSALKNTFKKLSLTSGLVNKVFRSPKNGPVKTEDALNASTDTLREDRERGRKVDDFQDIALREAAEAGRGYDNQAADIESIEDSPSVEATRARDRKKVENASVDDFKIED